MKSNLDPKIEAALCYFPFIGWIVAILMLVIEKSPDVRFHAAQALVLEIGAWVLMLIMGVTIILAILTPVVALVAFIVEIVMIIKTYQGQKVVLPVIGPWAQTLLGKVSK